MASIDTDVQSSGVRRVLWITLGLNLAVSAGKVVVGFLSGSLAMVADGYHSLVDGSNNVIGLIVAAFAFRPPDSGHPYGHRKFETAATSVIGIALLALAWEVLSGALTRTAKPAAPVIGALNWAVMAATIAVNLGVSWYEAREGRRLHSAFLVADAAHTRADLYVSLGVIGSFVAALLGFGWADPLVAVAIAGIIAWQAVRILRSAFDVLTDRAAIPAAALESLAAAVPGVLRVHGVRTRGRRDAVYVDLTVHLDAATSLAAAHAVADRIEAELIEAQPGIVDVVVHLEPEGHEAAS
jgi:cation diffusion facilitator family transporter